MNARVTEAHRKIARDLYCECCGIDDWTESTAQALADAEHAEREKWAGAFEEVVEEFEKIVPPGSLEEIRPKIALIILRARGTPAKEKADG